MDYVEGRVPWKEDWRGKSVDELMGSLANKEKLINELYADFNTELTTTGFYKKLEWKPLKDVKHPDPDHYIWIDTTGEEVMTLERAWIHNANFPEDINSDSLEKRFSATP